MAFCARGRGGAHNNCEENLERCYFAVWGLFDYSGTIVFVGLGHKIGETVCNEEVGGEIQMQ